MAERKGRSLYWLSRNADIPYGTLWNLSQKETQSSINLPVLSKLCTALECRPGDLLEHVTDADDAAVAAFIKSKGAKKAKKGSAK